MIPLKSLFSVSPLESIFFPSSSSSPSPKEAISNTPAWDNKFFNWLQSRSNKDWTKLNCRLSLIVYFFILLTLHAQLLTVWKPRLLLSWRSAAGRSCVRALTRQKLLQDRTCGCVPGSWVRALDRLQLTPWSSNVQQSNGCGNHRAELRSFPHSLLLGGMSRS